MTRAAADTPDPPHPRGRHQLVDGLDATTDCGGGTALTAPFRLTPSRCTSVGVRLPSHHAGNDLEAVKHRVPVWRSSARRGAAAGP